MSPSISLEKATETVMNLEKQIIKYPEVEETVSRIGRPEAGSHPHPVNYAEIHIELHPSDEWKRFENKQALVAALSAELSSWPGVQLNFTQPIQNAFDELLSGIRAQLAIKLYGEDLNVLPAVVCNQVFLSLFPPLKRLEAVGCFADIECPLCEGFQ